VQPGKNRSIIPGESSSDLVASAAWKKQINHPRIFIYETGKLDSVMLGKDTHYGKLHAKFITGSDFGYVGTSNFDYRSRLYNNEMGFFIEDYALNQDLVDEFELLKAHSYRWGSAEWLQMRNKVMKVSGLKGWSVRNQRLNYKLLKATGADWLF
jgi:phosphatidylserine/phosphatidylglycerophosphate/cardiolipin synthase-like enzyme